MVFVLVSSQYTVLVSHYISITYCYILRGTLVALPVVEIKFNTVIRSYGRG